MSVARAVVSGFGSGLFPVAPGTVGSLVAALLGVALMSLSPWALLLAALAAVLGGLWAIPAARIEGDPGWVVIDEFAGMWVAMLGLARPGVVGVAAAFLLFRLLDITKPGPIGWADRQPGATGIMADDVIAGVIVAGVLWAVRSRFPDGFAGMTM